MAKKKRKKRPPQRPTQRATGPTATSDTKTAERSASARAERKEQARRERERRIKVARRQQRVRRAARWGIAGAVVLGIGAFIWFQTRESAELQERARNAAEALKCDPIDLAEAEQPDPYAGMTPQQISQINHSPPFAQGQGGVPATAGPHSQALPPDPAVYGQPIPEANAVHNLEHGYVIVYYAEEGENAISDAVRSSLEDLVESESEVLMAPYPDLRNGIDLVAWRELQTCDPGPGADPDDATLVARAFIDRFKNGTLAPEPAAP
jgi:hypothetical protein